MSPIAQSIIRPVIIRSVKQIFYISMRVFVLAHKPVHWIWTQSVLVISIRLGTKSYSTDGYTWTMFPRFPRTLRLYIWHVRAADGSSVRGLSSMMWVRSWKVRPNCAVLMASRSGLFVEEPMSTLGFWVTGERTPEGLCAENRHTWLTHRIPQRNEIVTYNDTKGVI